MKNMPQNVHAGADSRKPTLATCLCCAWCVYRVFPSVLWESKQRVLACLCVCLPKVGQQEDRKPLLTCLTAVCDFMDTENTHIWHMQKQQLWCPSSCVSLNTLGLLAYTVFTLFMCHGVVVDLWTNVQKKQTRAAWYGYLSFIIKMSLWGNAKGQADMQAGRHAGLPGTGTGTAKRIQ